jgi:hypothetical protein
VPWDRRISAVGKGIAMNKLDAVHVVERAFEERRTPEAAVIRDVYRALAGCEPAPEDSSESLWEKLCGAIEVGSHFSAAYVDGEDMVRTFLGLFDRVRPQVDALAAKAPPGQRLVEVRDVLAHVHVGDRVRVAKVAGRIVDVASPLSK